MRAMCFLKLQLKKRAIYVLNFKCNKIYAYGFPTNDLKNTISSLSSVIILL